LDRSFLPADHAIMIPQTDDGRVLFLIPWHDRVLVGTTDTPVDEVSLEPTPLADEVAYLIDHANRYLDATIARDDVLSAFAGLRPLVQAGNPGEDTAAISREHTLLTSRSGLVTIAGGKWTTYHKMGQEAVDAAAQAGNLPASPSQTATLRIHGFSDNVESLPSWRRGYGADAVAIDELIAQEPDLGALLHPDLPYRRAEVVWAVRQELARTVEDVLSRRTRALALDAQASLAIAEDVAALMARELGRDQSWQADQVEQFSAVARGYQLD
jgi:glycerol-3-phosphate dehydrogenase